MARILNDFPGFRDGYRINILLKNEEILIEKIKSIIRLFSNYVENDKRNVINEQLKDIKQIKDFFFGNEVSFTI